MKHTLFAFLLVLLSCAGKETREKIILREPVQMTLDQGHASGEYD